ncbi:MAG: diguanylate cyclase [Solirubrobacterales bacterium]
MAIDPWYHLVLGGGWVAIVGTSMLDPNPHSADVIYPMLPMVIALMIFPLNRSWPYIVAGVVGSCGFVIFGQDTTPLPRAIVIAAVVMSAAALLVIGYSQLRMVLALNRGLAQTDPLTGAWNTRTLGVRLREEIAREERTETGTFGLLTLDLDAFKNVNDELGHSTGDRVLVEVARAIEHQTETGDLVARRGGDEFTILALHRPTRTIEQLRDRIADAVEEARTKLCPSMENGCSIGMAVHVPGEQAEAILQRADDALHGAKVDSHRRRGNPDRGQSQVVQLFEPIEGAAADDGRLHGVQPVVSLPSYDEMVRKASWQMLAGSYALIAVTVPLLGASGHSESISRSGVFAVCLLASLAAVLCVSAGRKLHSVAAIHAALLGTILLTTLLVRQSGEMLNATVDLLVIPAMVAFYVVRRKAAFAYAMFAMASYGYLISTTSYDLSVIRTIQTTAVVMLIGVILPRALIQTRAACDESERLSGADPLTGLANVRRMKERLGEELERATTLGGNVTVFMIDLDDFKQVNDRHSHSLGDRTLVEVAEAIQFEMRTYDLAVRRGGDEFMALVPHHGELNIDDLGTRLANAIINARLRICEDVNPNASIGHATNRPGDTVTELIARVDQCERSIKTEHRRRPLRAVG